MRCLLFSIFFFTFGSAFGINLKGVTSENLFNQSQDINYLMLEREQDDTGVVSYNMDGLKKTAQSLSDGVMDTGLDYFKGVLAYVVLIDYNFGLIDTLDARDASEGEFRDLMRLCKSYIFDLRRAIVLYHDAPFVKRSQFDKLTDQWMDCVEWLLDKYIAPLSKPMGKPDENWSESELKLWDKYASAYDKYLKIDQKWVDYQDVFAKANGFEIGGTIDYGTLED